MLFLLGVEHFQAQTIIRCLLSQLRPDSGEEFDGIEGNAQDIVRTQVKSMAALQGSAIGEKDDLHRRGGVIAFELDEKSAAVEGSHIRLQQDQIGLMLKNRAHIRAIRRHSIVSGAGELRHELLAQIVSDAKQ